MAKILDDPLLGDTRGDLLGESQADAKRNEIVDGPQAQPYPGEIEDLLQASEQPGQRVGLIPDEMLDAFVVDPHISAQVDAFVDHLQANEDAGGAVDAQAGDTQASETQCATVEDPQAGTKLDVVLSCLDCSSMSEKAHELVEIVHASKRAVGDTEVPRPSEIPHTAHGDDWPANHLQQISECRQGSPDSIGFVSGVLGVQDSTDEKRILMMRLFYASAEGLADEVERLLQGAADPNAKDYGEKTALHIAATHGHNDVAKTLLEYRAEPSVENALGHTPLMEAERRQYWNLVKTLQDVGAHMPRESLADELQRERWFIPRSEVRLDAVLCKTLTSTIKTGAWRGTPICAKFVKLDDAHHKSDEFSLTDLLHEIESVAQLRHPDIVLFLGTSLDEGRVFLITEFMPGGDLERYYIRKREEKNAVYRPGLARLVRWASCVARALGFLHGLYEPIIHGDLKPLKLLVTADYKDLKLTCTGISTSAQPDKNFAKALQMQKTCSVGSWRYIAPEVVRCETYTDKVDVYSFSLLLFFMSSGMEPFHEFGLATESILNEFKNGSEPRPKVSQCHPELRQIISAGWDVDPRKRPSASELARLLAKLSSDVQRGVCASM